MEPYLVVDAGAAVPPHDGIQGTGQEPPIAMSLVLRAAGQSVRDITENLKTQTHNLSQCVHTVLLQLLIQS